jgi:hypothetical protein
MTTQPRWEDSGQGDLLSLVADGPMSGHASHEWDHFVFALRSAAIWGQPRGRISPNRMRTFVRGEVAPRRIGAFTSRAVARGLIEATGEWEVSDDREGRNAGRPARVYRWIGGEL